MRILIPIISVLLATNVLGQSSDSLGEYNNTILNKHEIEFLNTSLKDSRDTFDFANKMIAFVTGSSGGNLISKREYFLTCIKPWTDKCLSTQISFVELTSEEKQKSGGYDAIVMSWVKLFTETQKKRIIEQLTRQNK